MQYALRPAHFPKHIDVYRAFAAGYFMRKLHLRDAAADAVFDQFFMPFGAGFAVEHLRDHVAIFVIAVGIHRRNCADSASSGPSARTCMVGCGNALAAFDQRPDFLATVDYGFQTLEHKYDPYVSKMALKSALPFTSR